MSSMKCPQCGLVNWSTDALCVRCGASLRGASINQVSSPVENVINDSGGAFPARDYAPPAPVWPTNLPPAPAPAVNVPYGMGHTPAGFRCPYCQSPYPPQIAQKISVGGWIVFAIFLMFCIPLCWIGLLMKEDYRVCSSCGMTLG